MAPELARFSTQPLASSSRQSMLLWAHLWRSGVPTMHIHFHPQIYFPWTNTLPVRSLKGGRGRDRTGQVLLHENMTGDYRCPSSQSTDGIHTLNTISFRVKSHPLLYLPPLPLLNPAFQHLGLTVPEHTNSLLSYLPFSLLKWSL